MICNLYQYKEIINKFNNLLILLLIKHKTINFLYIVIYRFKNLLLISIYHFFTIFYVN